MIEFETDTIQTLASNIHGELPVKIMIAEYQNDIKAQVVQLSQQQRYKITIEPIPNED